MSLRYLYGGDRPWNLDSWTASDDRVRGGISQSYLSATPSGAARFHGNLDITALGGAGFASQRTTGDLALDLSEYDGIVIALANCGDGKKYTLTIKDEIPPKRDDGRDQSTISWEYDFATAGEHEIVIRWADLQPTYRGRPRTDAEPLDLSNIKRISLLMRSFFGDQSGPFTITVEHIAAFTERPGTAATVYSVIKPGDSTPIPRREAAWKSWLCGLI